MKKLFLIFLTFPAFAAGPLLESYWETWNTKDSVETIIAMPCDIIDIAFGTFAKVGKHTFTVSQIGDELAFVQKAHEAGKKVKISVGGATYGLSGLLQSEADAEGMAAALEEYVTANELDGVDFDIEDYPAADLQIALIEQTRKALGKHALISYTPKAPASTTEPYNSTIKGAYQWLTNINIMAYDAYPGYSYEADVASLEAMGIPKALIYVGLMPGEDDTREMTSLDAVKDAAEYVVKNGLGGIMVWDLNRDHENLTGLGKDAATVAIEQIFEKAVR